MHIARFLLLTLFLLAGCSAVEPIVEDDPGGLQRSGTTNRKDQDSTIQLGYHYKPTTDDTNPSMLAQQAGFIILTKNDEAFRDQIRAAGYRGPILQYILANEIDGPTQKTNQGKCDSDFQPWQNQAANEPGDFCKYLDPNEDWFLHNGDGQRLYSTYQGRRYYRMNPASEGWRAFMLDRLKRHMFGDDQQPALGYDGFFLDNVELALDNSQNDLKISDGIVQEFDTQAEFKRAWRDWLKYMREGLGPDVPLWANLVEGNHEPDEWNDYLPYLDGVMNEAFVTGYRASLSREQQNNDLKQAEYALAQGKGVYAVSQGEQEDEQRQTFALASYLLIMQLDKMNYFRYSSDYSSWWLYDNYNVRLGAPLGPRYKVKNGWRRDFENGYVVVDQTKYKGKIVERPQQSSSTAEISK